MFHNHAQETKPEKGLSETANQDAIEKNECISEFFSSRGLVGELQHKDERLQVEPWFFFSGKKSKERPSCNELKNAQRRSSHPALWLLMKETRGLLHDCV